jgi:hypothetical protein
MSDEEQRPEGKGPAEGPAEGGLGLLFLAAAMGLVLILSLVGLVAYFAMSR